MAEDEKELKADPSKPFEDHGRVEHKGAEFEDPATGKSLRHDTEAGLEAVSAHPRAQGAPSASINDPEYRQAAKERGEGVDDANESTEPGYPVPVLKKSEHAEALHETAAHDVATTDQATRSTDIAGDTTVKPKE